MSLCTLHQYQTVSVCYDLTQLHKEYQQSTILSFRSLFCTLSRSCACLLISDLQRPESSTCMHMWAQATVHQVHWVWRQRDLRDMQGVWRWQHTRAQSTAQQVLHLWGPCQSHGDSVNNVHISERMFVDFQRWVENVRIIGDRGEDFQYTMHKLDRTTRCREFILQMDNDS